MARKTEKGGKFRNVHCRTWNMARKLKIMENEKHPLDDLKNDEITKKRENEKCTLKDLEYGEKTENHGKLEIHTLGREIWQGKLKNVEKRNVHCMTWNMARKMKIMENEKHTLDDLKNDEITKKREK